MTDYGTIKIPREDYERHNERRQELGLSWVEYVNGDGCEMTVQSIGHPAIAQLRDEIEDAVREVVRDELERVSR